MHRDIKPENLLLSEWAPWLPGVAKVSLLIYQAKRVKSRLGTLAGVSIPPRNGERGNLLLGALN